MASSSHPMPPEDKYKYIYRVDRPSRGTFIIINNKIFKGFPPRNGTDTDAANLYKLFRGLGFDVNIYNDQRAEDMLNLMIKAAEDDHDQRDCFGVAVLSHGDEGVLYGVDGEILIKNLIAPIKSCRSLAGKPKLFFFQASCGYELDEGQPAPVCDGPNDRQRQARVSHRIPRDADFLFAYSTTPGHVAWMHTLKGSWYVQALYKILSDETLRRTLDLVGLLTRVNYCVAYEFESNASDPTLSSKKQMPCVLTMLTKQLYFP